MHVFQGNTNVGCKGSQDSGVLASETSCFFTVLLLVGGLDNGNYPAMCIKHWHTEHIFDLILGYICEDIFVKVKVRLNSCVSNIDSLSSQHRTAENTLPYGNMRMFTPYLASIRALVPVTSIEEFPLANFLAITEWKGQPVFFTFNYSIEAGVLCAYQAVGLCDHVMKYTIQVCFLLHFLHLLGVYEIQREHPDDTANGDAKRAAELGGKAHTTQRALHLGDVGLGNFQPGGELLDGCPKADSREVAYDVPYSGSAERRYAERHPEARVDGVSSPDQNGVVHYAEPDEWDPIVQGHEV
eukprot:CAMPEP_0183322986 /NCGR_PEP_ID=MMETSP0160_2-20130417/73253_1 /TAXON_ID=2839 ORGANISM="Odontella Sinensis, Strain Grunow 1884" /NCGR_SAMPLE_ID=MMETSP0160_2 /ASSEMBLY_ACC=CAM_ASM_000250 /LENGTH=297 /DNA_ID=CAMNT_0025490273 /DNA_START=278 /DNA_END=1171 /DNA_ORIENTATION=+